MNDFSETLKLLVKFEAYKTPKNRIDKITNALMSVAVFFSLLLAILVGIYFINPEIDKDTVLTSANILQLLIIIPLFLLALIIVGSAIYYIYQFVRRFVVKKFRSSKDKESISERNDDQHLINRINHDKKYIEQLVDSFTLAQLKYIEKEFDIIIQQQERRITAVFGSQGAVLTMLLLFVALVERVGGIDSIIGYFSRLGPKNAWEYFMIVGLSGVLGLMLGALMLKVKIARHVYWHGLLQRALLVKQLLAEEEAREKQQKLLKQIESAPEQKTEEIRLSLLHRLLVLFTGKI